MQSTAGNNVAQLWFYDESGTLFYHCTNNSSCSDETDQRNGSVDQSKRQE